MKRKRFTEEQIIGILREQEAGAKVADLARKYAVSEATLYNWKAKFGGMDVSEAKRLKALEEENARLKKLLADQMLDVAALRELLATFPNIVIAALHSSSNESPAVGSPCRRGAATSCTGCRRRPKAPESQQAITSGLHANRRRCGLTAIEMYNIFKN